MKRPEKENSYILDACNDIQKFAQNNGFGNSELNGREPKKHLLCTILHC